MLNKLLTLLLTFLTIMLNAQSTNSWIVSGQYYYKVGIPTDGLFRISLSDLSAAGVPISSFNSDNLQLIHNGSQIPVSIVKSSGALNYIEFYGEKNTGWFDAEMFTSPEEHTNPHYSQITDTSAYFLTWNSSFNNKRYQSTTFNSEGTAVEHVYAEALVQYTGAFYSDEFPEYGKSKGWFDNQAITLGNSRVKTISLPSLSSNSENITLKIAVISFGSASAIGANHHLEIELPGGQIFDTTFTGKTSVIKNFTINTSQLTENNSIIFRSIDDLEVSADNMAVSYIHTIYPTQFNITSAQQKSFVIGRSTSNQVITLDGLSANEQPTIYDTANRIQPVPFFNGTQWQFSLPPSSKDHYVAISANKQTPAYIKQANVELPQLGNKYIIITHPKLNSSALRYANYRNADIILTDVLYNNFAYGIEKHPLATRNLIKYYNTQFGEYPEYLLLLGKSIDINSSRKTSVNHARNLVPSMGYPPSDVLLVSKVLEATNYNIPVAISRVAAETNEQVNNYLAKIQTYENESPAQWMKYIMHFGGGINSFEQSTFEVYLKNYERIIEDTLMGGAVSTFLKNSSDPIQITTSDSIRNMINNGASLLTFFGHGHAGGFDQDIDEPSAYSNTSRYPMIMANSCYSGNIHTTSTSSASEKWVLIPQKGAIAFLASVSEGYSNYLNNFSTEFYKNLAWKNYGNSIGKMLQSTISEHISNSSSQLELGTALTFTLHGDPKIVLNQFEKPDISLQNTQVQIIPREVSTVIDSFAIKFIATNLGRTISKNIGYSIEQTLPDGSDSTFIVIRENLFFNDTVIVYLPINRKTGVGLNQIRIVADYLNIHDEFNETNNTINLSINIKSTSLFPTYPYPFASYTRDTIVLKASTGDPFISQVTGKFEIDTTPLFNSGFKQSIEQVYNGGVIEWNTGIRNTPGRTYYWRAGSKTPEGITEWKNNSFTTVTNQTGWVQNTKNQLAQNEFQFIDFENNTFYYADVPRELFCYNIGSPTSNQASDIYYRVASNITTAACEFHNSMVVVVIDSASFVPWAANHGNYGQLNYPQCSSFNYPHPLFVFHTSTTESLDYMMNFINEVVPDGFYLLTYSFRSGLFETWKERHFETYEALGAQLIRGVPNDYPYIFFTQKGNQSIAQEVVGNSATDIITLSATLKDNFDYGSITTQWIGPARKWNNFAWDYNPNSLDSSDSIKIAILSKNALGKSDYIIANNIPISATPYDISDIDASQHPHLKVEFYTRDKINKTPAIPSYISCDYEPQSDIAISPGDRFLFPKDSIQEGDLVELQLAYRNISDIISEVKGITYKITDVYNRQIATIDKTLNVINPNAFQKDTVAFQTTGLRGYHTLWVEYDQDGTQDFFSFNNLGSIPFLVYGDEINPLLDVTFDGRHIMNGDIISSTPNINIQLSDENPYLSLNDTSLFAIYLTNISEGVERRVYLQPGIEDGSILWLPAINNNDASITYMPIFEESGFYELRVQARDISNNLSGSNDYTIQFQVINESTITHLFNYPNPFSTRTRFVFTLTGNQIPDEINISIYTISGKMVKTIHVEELGPIYIGNNITEYAWDGKDEFGDQLANGVYLYRVNIEIDGQKVDVRKTDADGFFNRGWGKMYLLR